MLHELSQRAGIPYRCCTGVYEINTCFAYAKCDSVAFTHILIEPFLTAFENVLLVLTVVPRSCHILHTICLRENVILIEVYPVILDNLGSNGRTWIEMNIEHIQQPDARSLLFFRLIKYSSHG